MWIFTFVTRNFQILNIGDCIEKRSLLMFSIFWELYRNSVNVTVTLKVSDNGCSLSHTSVFGIKLDPYLQRDIVVWWLQTRCHTHKEKYNVSRYLERI